MNKVVSKFEYVRPQKFNGSDYIVVCISANDPAILEIQIERMVDWCTTNFGGVGDLWSGYQARWYNNGDTFWFHYEEDFALFALRWG